MTGKERFLTAINGGKPDRVPVCDWLEGKRIFQKVLGRDISVPDGADIMSCSVMLGFDAAFVAFGGSYDDSPRTVGATYKDEWGVSYRNTGVSWPFDAPCGHPIESREDLEEWRKGKPDPRFGDRLSDVRKAVEISQGNLAVVGTVIGPLTMATFLLGFAGALVKLVEDPGLVEEIFRISNEFFAVGVDAMIEAGVDTIAVAEDLGFRTGTFASPDLYRAHLFPYLQALVGRARVRNVPVFLHSDGNLNELLDDLVGLGINALHPIERKANMDIGKIRERYGTEICLVGNISASDTLPYGPADRIEEEVKATIRVAGREGAYILASDSDYHDGIPPENFIAMIGAARKHGGYPIA